MEIVLGLIGGLGIGTLLTAVVTHFISRHSASLDRVYCEKREAYLGLLDALHRAAVQPSDFTASLIAFRPLFVLRRSPRFARAGRMPSQT